MSWLFVGYVCFCHSEVKRRHFILSEICVELSSVLAQNVFSALTVTSEHRDIVCPGCSDVPSTHSWDRNGTTDMDNLKTHCQLSLARRDKTNQATAIRDKYSVFIENETIREDLLRTTTTSGYVLCKNANHCRIKRPKNTNKRLSVLCEATAGEVHLANTGHKICS